MSNKVDERITRIRFDNDQFEKGVATSLQSIDRLKNKLESTESVHAFEGIQRSADKTDLSGIAKAVDNISDKFSVLHHVVIDVLSDITKKAIEAGANLAKSLSVEDMIAGWQKYDQEVSAVQTIMVTLDDTPIQEVETALEKIGWFSDETSYSYEQMVNSMSKFISAGSTLDAARDAVIGVANAAAAAGVSTKNAERAFYNFSQAMGVGYMQLMDWRSIENLNMATPEFKRNILETAAALGKIVKVGDDLYKMEGETDPDNFFTSLSMSQSLKNKWFDKDVILEVSKLYSGFANQVYEVQNAMDFDTASETMDWLEDAGKAIDDVSNKAFRAAQEAKTFSEAIGSVKDALGTKWKETFKEIFGNYEQATKLWTAFANELYDLVATSSDTRNEILKQWNDPATFLLPEGRLAEMYKFPELKTGREILLEGLWNIYYSVVNVVNTIKSAWSQVFPEITAKRLYFMTKRFRDFSKKILEFTENLEGVEEFLTGLFKGIKGTYNTLWPVVQKSWGYLKNVFQDIWSFFKGAWEYLKPTDIYEGLINTVDGIWNLWQSFSRVGSVIIEAWKEVFPDISNWFIVLTTKFKEITELILGTTDDLSGFQTFVTDIFKIFRFVWNVFKKVFHFFEGFLPVLQKVWDIVKNIGSQIWQFFKDAWEYLKQTETFSWVINRIEEDLKTLKETFLGFDATSIKLPTFEDFLNTIKKVTDSAGKFGELIGSAFGWIRKQFKRFLPAKALEEVSEATNNVAESAVLVLELFTSDEMAETRSEIKETGETCSKVFTWLKDNVGGVLTWLKDNIKNFNLKDLLATGFLGVFSWFTIKMGTATANVLEAFDVLSGAVATGVAELLTSVGGVFGGFKNLIGAYTKNIKAQTIGEYIGYIKNIAIAILAIVAAMYIFNKIEDPEGNIKRTITIIGLLGAGLIALVVILGFVSGKINAYSKGVNTTFSLFSVKGLTVTGPKSNGIMSIVLGILGLVLAFKFMYNIISSDGFSEDKFKNVRDTLISLIFTLTACVLAMQGFSALLAKLGINKPRTSTFAILGIAGGILMMVRAFNEISKMELDKLELTILKVVEIFGVMLGASLVLKHLDTSAGFGFLAIAAAVLVFVHTLKYIKDQNITIDLANPLIWVLSAIVIILGILSVISQRGKILKQGEKLKRVNNNMLGVVIGLVAFVAATKILGEMERDKLIQGAIAAGAMIIALMGMISLMVHVAGKVGQYAGKGLFTLSILIAVVGAVFTLVSIVTYLNRNNYMAAIQTMITLFGGVALMMVPLIFFKEKIGSGLLMLTFLVLSLGALVLELYYIAKNNPDGLAPIINSLCKMLISLGLMAFLLSRMNTSNVLINSAQILMFIGFLLLELGATIAILSYVVKDTSTLMESVSAMALLAVFLGGITALLGVIPKGNMANALGFVGVLGVLATVLGGVVIALSQWVNGENLSFLKTYGKELLALVGVITGLTVVLSLLGMIGPTLLVGAAIGVLALTLVIAGIVGIILLLEWVFHDVDLDSYKQNFEKLAEVMYVIGQAIGAFFGGITAGRNKGKIDEATSSLEAMTPLAQAMIPLSDAFSELPTDFSEKATAFKEGIKTLKSVSGEFRDISGFSEMLTTLDSLAPQIKALADKITASDFGNLTNLASAVESIRNINQWVYSIKNEEVSAVTKKFLPIVNNLAIIDPRYIKKATKNVPLIVDLLSPLGGLFDSLGEVGIKGNIFEGKYIDGFNDVISAISTLKDTVPVDDLASYDPATLDRASENSSKLANFLSSFGSLISSMPKTGGVAGLFGGEEATTFENLPTFADAVIRYGNQLLATENVRAVNAAVGVTTNLSTAFQLFFGQDMPAKIRDVAAAIGELAAAGVDKVATFFTDTNSIYATKAAITNLTENFRKELNNEIKDNRIVSYMQMLYSTILSGIRNEEYNFYLAGGRLRNSFINGVLGQKKDVFNAGSGLARSLESGTGAGLDSNSPSRVMYQYGEYAGIGFYNGVEDTRRLASESGIDLSNALLNSIITSLSIHSPSWETFLLGRQGGIGFGQGFLDAFSNMNIGEQLKGILTEQLGGVFNLDGTDVSPDKLLDEFILKPLQNKRDEVKKLLSDMTLEDITSGNMQKKIGDAFANSVFGSMDSAAISSAHGEAITTALLKNIPGVSNVEEVLSKANEIVPTEEWVDNLFNGEEPFDWASYFDDINLSYSDMISEMSDNPIQSVWSDDPISSYLPSSYDYQNFSRAATGSGTVAGYTAEDVRALTTEIHGLEDALYSLKEVMKDQHMVHSGEITVKYTNESDFIDRVQTAIVTSIRREARG